MALQRKPGWLKKKTDAAAIMEMEGMLRPLCLHTARTGAKCPNRSECFGNKIATFLILGDMCMRNCRFCAVRKGKPTAVDPREPENVATTSEKLGLRHIVVTSVTRHGLPDGGAAHFAKTLRALREGLAQSTVEVLIPDFQGNLDALRTVMDARPEIINHNVETVPRLYPAVRPMARYDCSLRLLARVKELGDGIFSKTGVMVGPDETEDEVSAMMDDLVAVGCDIPPSGSISSPPKTTLKPPSSSVQASLAPACAPAWRRASSTLPAARWREAPATRRKACAR